MPSIVASVASVTLHPELLDARGATLGPPESLGLELSLFLISYAGEGPGEELKINHG